MALLKKFWVYLIPFAEKFRLEDSDFIFEDEIMQQSYKEKFIGIFLLLTFLFGNFSAFSQTRKANGGQTTTSTSKKEEKAECKGGYSGIVWYIRKDTTKNSGKFGSNYSKIYTYQSNIIIRDDTTTQGTIYKDYNGIGGSFNFTGKAFGP